MNDTPPVDANVLVVDDTADNLALLSNMLHLQGYKVRVANSGARALAAIQTLLPDLILLDVMMPQMSGYQVCEQLKANPATEHIPVIFLSALDHVEDKIKAFKAGGVDYITKPFHLTEVLARVKTHLVLLGLQQQLRHTNQALESKLLELQMHNDELDAFAHTVAHDLKSPLSVIDGYADMLLERLATQDIDLAQQVDYLHHIHRGAHRMDAIIDSLLLLAGVRKRHVQCVVLDMAAIVAEVQQGLAQQTALRQGQITWPSVWPATIGYGPWVEQVWHNYLSNALKYGGEPPAIEVGVETLFAHQVARFWVKDNGPGLSPAEQKGLFTPFTRIHTNRAEGHGLGLSIVQRIVEKLGGQVGVESTLGQGSKFFFTLPLADGEWQMANGR